MPRRDLGMPTAVTVSLRNRATGATVTRCANSSRGIRASLRDALAGLPASEWRIVCVSTPATIRNDLRRSGRPYLRLTPERSLLLPAGLGEYLAE